MKMVKKDTSFLGGRLQRVSLLFVAIATLLVLAACGGGGDDAPASTPAAVQTVSNPLANAAVSSAPSVEVARMKILSTRDTVAAADQLTEADLAKLQEVAANLVPELFPRNGGQAATRYGVLIYSHYPATGTYLAIATATGEGFVKGNVYATGGRIGNLPDIFDAGPIGGYVTPANAPVTVVAQIWASVWDLKAKPFAATWYPYLVTVYSDYSYEAKPAVNSTGWTVGASPLGGCTFRRADTTPAETLNAACKEAKGGTYQYFTWTKGNNTLTPYQGPALAVFGTSYWTTDDTATTVKSAAGTFSVDNSLMQLRLTKADGTAITLDVSGGSGNQSVYVKVIGGF